MHRTDVENGQDDAERPIPLFTGDFIKYVFTRDITASFGVVDLQTRPARSLRPSRSVVFGGLDGLITALAIVAAAAGGSCGWDIVVVIGFASIAANALSMGAGEYLSSKAHKDFVQAEKRREMWEFKHFKDVEIKEVRRGSCCWHVLWTPMCVCASVSPHIILYGARWWTVSWGAAWARRTPKRW